MKHHSRHPYSPVQVVTWLFMFAIAGAHRRWRRFFDCKGVPMKITRQMCLQIVSISALQRAMPDVLSDFETETLQTVKDRALGLKRSAQTTAAEWQVVETAHDALRKALNARGTLPAAFRGRPSLTAPVAV